MPDTIPRPQGDATALKRSAPPATASGNTQGGGRWGRGGPPRRRDLSGKGIEIWPLPDRREWTKLKPNSVEARFMRLSNQIKPISFLKANAAEIMQTLADGGEPMIITQNGEAKAVIQDIASFERTQETMALLKILALGNQEIEAGKTQPARDVAARLKAKFAVRG
jgi:prevent-host-death family protein